MGKSEFIASGNHGIFATDQYYPTSGNYDFRYKSVECGQNDKVIVDYGSYPDRDSVIFKDKYGVKLKVVDGNILSFTGVSKADTNYIYAYRGDQKIGKLFLNTYQQKTYKVVFVRVNGAAKKLNAKEITKYLNKVYNQCAVSFEDSIDNITIGNLTSFSHGGSGILTVYNDYQKEVLQAYEKEKKMKDGVFYLFFIDNVTDKKDGNGTPVSGYMPRGYNAGFIYDGGSPHTIAHELGHGIAGLEHVFENSNNSGKTANLMDYANGEELWHFQWDQIQDPSRVWMKWNKAEGEGENVEEIFKYVVTIFSPYFSHQIRYASQNSATESERNNRIFELLNSCYRQTFNENTKSEILLNIQNPGNVNIDYLKDHNRLMKIQYYTNTGASGCRFNFLCGTHDNIDPDKLTRISPPYEFITDDNIISDKYIDAIYVNNLPGEWKTEKITRYIENKKELAYNEQFDFTESGSYFKNNYVKYRLLNGAEVLSYSDDEGDRIYKIKPVGEELWYEIYMSGYTNNDLAKEISDIFTRLEVNTLKTIGRYALPVEDCIILIDGKDFEGIESSKVIAGVSLAVDLIPVAGKFFKLVKTGAKASKTLTKETVKQIIKSEAKEYVTDATISFVIDVGTQFLVNLMDAVVSEDDDESEDDDDPFFKAISTINFVEKAQLSLSSSISNNNNKVLIEAIVCAEKGCMAFKKAQGKIRQGKDANIIQDAVVTCLFDVFINMDMDDISKCFPNSKIKYFCENWSKFMTRLNKKCPEWWRKYNGYLTLLGNIFEQIYYHD